MKHLTIPIALLSVILLLTAGGAAWYVHQIQASHSEVLDNNVTSVRAAQELEISIREVQFQIDRYLITGNRQHLEPIPRLRQRTDVALAEAIRLATTRPEQAFMERVRLGHEHFFLEYERLAKEPLGAELRARVAELTDTVLDQEILDPAHEYLRFNEGVVTRTSEANRTLADRLVVGLVVLGCCGAAGGIAGGWVLSAAVRRSLQRTEARLRDTALRLGGKVGGGFGRVGDVWQQVSESVSDILRRLKKSERDALRAEQLAWVGQLAAGIAHEIRNPLMAIKMIVQTAADPHRGRRLGPRDLAVLEEEIVRLEDLTANFLDFARPPTPDKQPVALLPIVEQAVSRVQSRADLHGVRIEVGAAEDPCVADADPSQVRQVVYNLLFNALEAQPRGGWVRILIAPSADQSEAGDNVVLTVEDEGPGLPGELGDRIFDPFVSTKDTGLGLGLSICRRIADDHGGNIRSANRATGGAIFTVRMPAASRAPRSVAAATKVLAP